MPTWDSGDFDSPNVESDVVHESVANTDHDNASEMKRGYSVESPPFASDLVGYYPLHEDSGTTAHDFSGGNHDMSNNNVTVDQPGIMSTTSFDYNGSSSYTRLSDATHLQGLSKLSVAFWLYPRDLSSGQGVVVDRDGQWDEYWGFRIIDSSTFRWEVVDNGNFDTIADANTSDLSSNAWNFVVGTFDGSTGDVNLYLDGSSWASSSGSSSQTDNANELNFGMTGGVGEHLDGRLAYVFIWNRVLTSSEVSTLYDRATVEGAHLTRFKSV